MDNTINTKPIRKMKNKPQHGQDHSVQGKKGYFIVSVIILVVIAILFIFPLYWIITGSFKTPQAVNARVPVWFPTQWTTVHYGKLFQRPAFQWLGNTVLICGLSMLLTCITASMGGYALAKKKFAGRAIIFPCLYAPWPCPSRLF